ncbi:MAG: hypothetical protein HY271_01915 [Deltaproteobacteria bacterium]|nr:hypothetical protein [Deltaproteobacteria bacterium]
MTATPATGYNRGMTASPSPMSPHVPAWIEVRRGIAPLLFFAPHAGRRTLPRRPGRDKVNDLHTGGLTRELGAACDATWIINTARDRNEIDLNRTPQVREHASWLLEFLATTLEEMVAERGRATLFAVHGWNVVQAVCDLGVGLVEENGACRRAARGDVTVSRAFLHAYLRRMQRLASVQNVLVTIGVRYPAAHPSNLMQLLTPGRVDDADPLLRRLARLADRVDAVQLEVGIPLRWRGPRRSAFVRTLADVFAAAPPDSAPRREGDRDGEGAASFDSPRAAVGATLACGGRPTTRVALQVASAELAVLTSVDVAPAGAIAGRLLITDAAERLALFTGELAERHTHTLHVPALRVDVRDHHAFDVRFAGPLLAFPMLTPFADLERGLAAGNLRDARLHLRFAPASPLADLPAGAARFGTVTGVVRLGGTRHRVRALAWASAGLAPPRRHPSARLVLPGTALGDLELCSTDAGDSSSEGPRSSALTAVFRFALTGTAWSDMRSTPVRGVADVHLDEPATVRVRVQTASGASRVLAGRPERLIPVRRPGSSGSVVESVYALCRFTVAPTGWLELTVEHAAGDAD